MNIRRKSNTKASYELSNTLLMENIYAIYGKEVENNHVYFAAYC